MPQIVFWPQCYFTLRSMSKVGVKVKGQGRISGRISLKLLFFFSVSAEDELWGINHEGQLCQRRVYYLQRNDVLEDLDTQQVNRNSISEDWEFI